MGKGIPKEKKYLVVSMDTDEQQLFYDFVTAFDEQGATLQVLEARPYAVGADAIQARELSIMSRKLNGRTVAQVRKTWNDFLQYLKENE